MAFIFADLIVLPIIAVYRKYYGTPFALRIVALMFVTMVLAALLVDVAFGAVGLIPSDRPSTEDVFGGNRTRLQGCAERSRVRHVRRPLRPDDAAPHR